MPLNVVGYRLVSGGEKTELIVLGVGLGDKDIAGIQGGNRYFLDNCWKRFKFGDQDVMLVVAAVEGEEELRDFTEWIGTRFPPDLSVIEKAREWCEISELSEVIPIGLPPRLIASFNEDEVPDPEFILRSVLDRKDEVRAVVVVAELVDRSQEVCWSKISLSSLCKAWLALGEEIGKMAAEGT